MSTSSFNYEREFFSFAENVTLNHFHHNYDVVLFVNLDFNRHALWFFFSLSISRHLWAFPAIKVHDHILNHNQHQFGFITTYLCFRIVISNMFNARARNYLIMTGTEMCSLEQFIEIISTKWKSADCFDRAIVRQHIHCLSWHIVNHNDLSYDDRVIRETTTTPYLWFYFYTLKLPVITRNSWAWQTQKRSLRFHMNLKWSFVCVFV